MLQENEAEIAETTNSTRVMVLQSYKRIRQKTQKKKDTKLANLWTILGNKTAKD